jgi:hypothetical protein
MTRPPVTGPLVRAVVAPRHRRCRTGVAAGTCDAVGAKAVALVIGFDGSQVAARA